MPLQNDTSHQWDEESYKWCVFPDMNDGRRHLQKVAMPLFHNNTTLRVFFLDSYLSHKKHFMRKLFVVPVFLIFSNSFSQTVQQLESKRVGLPNGWSLTPVGKSLPLGDLPLNMAISPNK